MGLLDSIGTFQRLLAGQFAGVKEIYATDRAFCAVCDGTIVTWGDPMYGGDSPCDLWRRGDPWDDNPVET